MKAAAADPNLAAHRTCKAHDGATGWHECGRLSEHGGQHECPCGERWFR